MFKIKEGTTKYIWSSIRSIVALILTVLVTIGTGSLNNVHANTNIQDGVRVDNVSMNFITGKEQSVTLKSIDMALSSALQRLAREAKVGISYNPDDIPDQTVEFEFKNVSVHQALYTLLEGTNLVARLSPTKDVILINKTNNPLKLNHSESIIQETVSGRVTDTETGETLPGVNILIKGTTTGTTTATNGSYEFLAPSLNDTLVFSYIGYQTQEIPINGRNELDVQLEYDVMGVEDLVVVGYGTQREQTLTGSISVVDMSGVERVSMPTVGQALMGRTPGVLFHNSSGHPGRTELSINIRGYGAPLIIVDGTPVSEEYFQNINSIDIESVNVLKDASAAAVYGARAGNGVMIVTTKRGNISAPQFSYRGEYARQFTPNKPGLVNASQYAEMENLGNYNQGLPPRWTPEQIELLSNGTDPNYPNHNYWDLVIRDSAPQHQNTLSVRGGSETVQYFVSGEWFNQDGFLRSDAIKYDRYSLRSNLDLYLTERLSMGLDVALTNRDYFGPSTEVDRHKAADGLGPEEIMMRIWRARPYCREDPFDDGRLRAHCGGVAVSPTILMDTDKVGFYDWNQLYGFSKLNLEYDFSDGIFEGVLLGANFDFNRTYRREKVNHKMATQYDQDPETGEYIVIRSANAFSQVIENQSIVDNINQNYYLKWINQFGQHDFNFLALYERLYDNFDDFSADRRNYEMDIPYLFAGPDLDKNNYGIAREGGREAFVSRLNYSYQDKYLFEINGRFDASPNFPPESRWGFFPSAAIGWRMSEEDFIKDNLSFIDHLRLRLSHGKLGFDRAGDFQYLATYGFANPYLYENDQLSSSLGADALPNPNMTWETMQTSNVGIDFQLFGNQIEGSLDAFYRKRTNVLGSRQLALPNIVGADMPQENFQEFDNRGFETSLAHNRTIGEVSFRIGGNVTWTREKTILTDQSSFATMEEWRRGNSIGEWRDRHFVWSTDGLFGSYEEIQEYGVDIDGRNNATIQPGDVKYDDINGDGRITSDDMIIAGRGRTPTLMYGLDIFTSWKGLQLNMLFQGAGLYNLNLRDGSWILPFSSSDTPLPSMYSDSYIPEDSPWMEPNPDTNARYPLIRHSGHGGHPSWRNNMDIWLVDGSYIRLKNIQLSYSIPVALSSQLGLTNASIFVSGYNVLTYTFTDWPSSEFGDPENHNTLSGGSVRKGYPVQGTYNIGVNLGF